MSCRSIIPFPGRTTRARSVSRWSGSFSPRFGDDRYSSDTPINVRGLGPDGPKSGAASFRSDFLLGIVWQHVRIIQYNAVKYEHFGRIKTNAVTGDSLKTLFAFRKALPKFVPNSQGCANRIVYEWSTLECCSQVRLKRKNLQAMPVCTANFFCRHRLNADQPENLRPKLCSEFQCDRLEIVNEGFAFNYPPFVFCASRTCRDDDGHRKRKDLNYQAGTDDAGGLHAYF